MGVVWRATQLGLNRTVALKAIALELSQDVAFRDRFQREAQLAASIEHPNVIPVYGAGEFDDRLYLIMRWVDGTDLRHLLNKAGRLTPGCTTRLLIPVALALGAAHRRDLIHRDVKPANVLISGYNTDEERVYLTDFGIARRPGGDMTVTRTGVLVGTLDYIAPERIEGGKGDAASDIYAFGCMLYETLTGKVPYQRPIEVAKLNAHLNDPVPSARATAPDVPESLDRIIATSMAKRPESRFGSADELADALTRSTGPTEGRTELATDLHERPTVLTNQIAPEALTRVPGTTTRADDRTPTVGRGSVRRRRAVWLVVPVALLLAAGAVVAVLASGGGTQQSDVSSGARATGGLRVVARIALPGSPSAIAADGSASRVWVTGPGYVWAEPGGLHARFNGTPSAIAAGSGQVWISDPTAGELRRFTAGGGGLALAGSTSLDANLLALDPRDGSVYVADTSGRVAHVASNLQLTQLGDVTPAPTDLAFGEGKWLWAVNGDQLIRIGTSGSATTKSFSDGSNPVSVTLNRGVWAAHGDGHVTRFDPRASFRRPDGVTAQGLDVNADIAVASPSALSDIVAIDSEPDVWTASSQTRTVYRIDYDTLHISGTVTFPSPPIGLAVTSHSVWVITRDAKLIEIGG
jgi:Protein kinase domain